VAAALAITGAALRPLPVIARALIFVCGYLTLLACFVIGFFLDWDSDGWAEERTVAAPHGAGRRAVVWQGSAVLDPLYRVTVIQGTGLDAREWVVACFNGDDESAELKRITWTAPDSLLLTDAGGRTYAVHFDPRSGRPRRVPGMEC
jgi:hypothetical protein